MELRNLAESPGDQEGEDGEKSMNAKGQGADSNSNQKAPPDAKAGVGKADGDKAIRDAEQQQSLLYSSDLELGETTKQIFQAMERTRPSRVVLDSLSEIRLLAQSSLRYRRQILAMKHYFAKFGTTVKYRMKDLGYADEFIDELTRSLLIRISGR